MKLTRDDHDVLEILELENSYTANELACALERSDDRVNCSLTRLAHNELAVREIDSHPPRWKRAPWKPEI